MSKYAAQITLSIWAEDIGEANARLVQIANSTGRIYTGGRRIAEVTGSAVGEAKEQDFYTPGCPVCEEQAEKDSGTGLVPTPTAKEPA